MEHTWHDDHQPKLEIANLEGGDVAVCGSFAGGRPILPEFDEKRVGFVAPLASRSDLEWMLRGLCLHPNIRHLVICGEDRNATGESLLALWQHGLDAGGLLPGARGSLSAELDTAAVNALRSDVQIWDWRTRPLSEVAGNILDLPSLTPEREPKTLPNPEIPGRKVYHSRRTTFPIFSSDVGDSWLQLLNLVLKIGTDKRTAEGERISEALNAVVTIDTPELEDGEKPNMEDVFPTFFDFNREDFDRIHEVQDRFAWSGSDQLEAVCDRLKKSSDTRSGTLVFLEASQLANSETSSGLLSATFNIVDEKLFGSFVLRSADLYTDWPIEALALVRLQCQTAKRLGFAMGSATFMIHSAHLYERDWNRSLRVLKEHFKRPLPLHVDPSGIFLFGNDGGKATAMLLAHDASQIFWEEGFSDPEDLSWFIVDTMPWLLPQHIRYVGQECAALMKAMKDGECYLQG